MLLGSQKWRVGAHCELGGDVLGARCVVVVALVDDDGQRAQLCGRHALLAPAQQAVPQPPWQAPHTVPPPAACIQEQATMIAVQEVYD